MLSMHISGSAGGQGGGGNRHDGVADVKHLQAGGLFGYVGIGHLSGLSRVRQIEHQQALGGQGCVRIVALNRDLPQVAVRLAAAIGSGTAGLARLNTVMPLFI